MLFAFCNRKRGNCREKPILHLYAKYDSWAEICPEIQKKIFPAVSPLSIAKGPYDTYISHDTHNSIWVEDHLTLIPEGAISYDTYNSICVKDHLTLSPKGVVSYDP